MLLNTCFSFLKRTNGTILQRLLLIVAAITTSLSASTSYAGDEDGVANYAYAVFAGTGKYSILDRTIYIVSMPLAYNIKKNRHVGKYKIGFKVLLPVAIGVTNFERFDELPDLDIDSLQTMSFVRGLEIPIGMIRYCQSRRP